MIHFFVRLYRKICIQLKHYVWFLTHLKKPDFYSIPIIINNFNRLTYLRELIQSLQERGYNNIIILDNDSTYPPLLEFYETCPYEVIHLGKNYGFLAIWETDVYARFKNGFYVYTDSDVVLDESCPADFMFHLWEGLRKHPRYLKVGLGIRIDNLPDSYDNKAKVIAWESKFWEKKIDDAYYDAQVDTTFALYRPYCWGPAEQGFPHLRTGLPYVICHKPWYVDSKNLSEEDQYYKNISSKTSTMWTRQ